MTLFYDLPIWLGSLFVLLASVIVGLASSFGLRRVLGLHATAGDAEHAVSLMQVVAAYIGILIAFAGVQVWQDFSNAQEEVHREAAAGVQLYRDLATYGPEMAPTRQALRAYVDSVTRDEWPLLARGEGSPATEVALFRLFSSIGSVQPADDRDSTIYAEAFGKLNDLVSLRRDRLIHSQSGMPMILWLVGLAGSILIVAYTATFRPNRTNALMISGISLALGLMFLFILIVDRPYQGEFSVSNDELRALDHKFDLIDRLVAAAEGRGAGQASSVSSSTAAARS